MTTKPSATDWSQAMGVLPGRKMFGPLFLMASTPPFVVIYSHVCTQLNGNFYQYFKDMAASDKSLYTQLMTIWPDQFDPLVWKMILSFLAFELVLMRVLPGKKFRATVTPTGHTPVYKANGMISYIVTLCTMMALDYFDIFKMSLIYDNYPKILSSLNVFALLFCLMLLIKGYVAPSSSDSGTTGDLINDFYWGMELYPRILGWDLKQFTNCRAGMMFWPVAVLSFCYKNMELNDGKLQLGLAVSVALQLVYCSKFFHWEMGYMCSMDIQHDRAGHYICWGCLVWVPAVYTSAAFYLTESGPPLSKWLAATIFICGWLCICINYESDHQRYVFRQTDGDCFIWGKKPEYITATYFVAGEKRTSLLLVDGWWVVSRHFHYVPEILASFFWSVSALNSGFLGPYFYVIFLTILLTDRAFRDDSRCRAKYGQYWDEYCEKVPWKIVPFVV